VNTVNWAFAGKTKAGSPSTVPPTQTTMLFEERFPDVFLIHTACVELPAVIRIRLGTVARNAPISVVAKSMLYPLGYEFTASILQASQ
jgi:hypothetical protein